MSLSTGYSGLNAGAAKISLPGNSTCRGEGVSRNDDHATSSRPGLLTGKRPGVSADPPPAEAAGHPDRRGLIPRHEGEQDRATAAVMAESRSRAEYSDQVRNSRPAGGAPARPSDERAGSDPDIAGQRSGESRQSGDGSLTETRLSWLQRPDRPPGLPSTRPYDRAGGLARPASGDQRALEDAVPAGEDGRHELFPAPRERWAGLVNDGGPEADRFRGNNCLDCSLSLISTFHGRPEVAAPSHPDRTPGGRPAPLSGEAGGTDRAEQWLGHAYEDLGAAEEGCQAIADKLRQGGHGSAAAIISTWHNGGSHAWNAVNHHGEITWIDSQVARIGPDPVHPPARIAEMWAIVIDQEGKRL
jgi:hypothetical protein